MARALGRLLLALVATAALAGAGCAGTPDPAEGRVLYLAQGRGGSSRLTLSTEPPGVKVVLRQAQDERSDHPERGIGPSRDGPESKDVNCFLTPDEMGALLAALDDDGFFDLPGQRTVPEKPVSRSISVDAGGRRFYIAFVDLRDEDEIQRYGRAARRVIAASQGGLHSSMPAGGGK